LGKFSLKLLNSFEFLNIFIETKFVVYLKGEKGMTYEVIARDVHHLALTTDNMKSTTSSSVTTCPMARIYAVTFFVG
jgi:hypothetical protein